MISYLEIISSIASSNAASSCDASTLGPARSTTYMSANSNNAGGGEYNFDFGVEFRAEGCYIDVIESWM
jgi:hypothetical protein